MSRKYFDPRPWQPLGTSHILANPYCALWADMGMGKGVMTLTALTSMEMTEDPYPVLVLGPKRVAHTVWPQECDKWHHLQHLSCVSLVGSREERLRALKYNSPIYSINYENLPWLVEHWGDAWPYKTIIADEARKLAGYRGGFRKHPKTGKVYLQSAGSVRARALAKAITQVKPARFIELTGRPAPQGLTDLWGQLWFLDSGDRLGRTFESFQSRWFGYSRPVTNENRHMVSLVAFPHTEKEIHAKIGDICLTIDPADWLDLEKPVINNVYIDLPAPAAKLYSDMEKQMFAELEGATVEAFGAAAKTQKCLQLANGAVYIDQEDPRPDKEWRAVHEAKLEALDSILEESDIQGGVMIVYTFRSDRARIMKAYPESVDLSAPSGEAAFKKGEALLGICHPQSIGHGVDGFQNVCNTIIHFGNDWSLDYYDQINARIGAVRQMQAGFKRPTYVYHILARNTLDEDVMDRRATKRSVQEILLNAAKRRRHD